MKQSHSSSILPICMEMKLLDVKCAYPYFLFSCSYIVVPNSDFFNCNNIYLIELLCSQYGIDDRISRLVNETNIFIIPTMNPDGMS